MAFIYVQHLDPKHSTILPQLLARESKMPVKEATEGARIKVNHVYVITPNTNLGVSNGVLHVMPRLDARGHHMPVDYFFHSLAADCGSRAIGVILSGTASDGAHGLRAIKAEGGITFAQDSASAEHDGMPRSAIASASVDFILPPNDIARELKSIGQHPYVAPSRPLPADALPDGGFNRVLSLIRSASGVDFNYYKQSTIKRRILRRMALQKTEKLDAYLTYLEEHPAEIHALFNDILINVTSFFRNPDTFEALQQQVFPRLVSERRNDNPIRIWVPGASTGEEAYSMAIALLESLGDRASEVPIQLFATDLNETAIAKARAGIYPESIVSDVSPERLRRFFVRNESGYQVSKRIRDMCIFARQNLTKDPPFSNVDLVSCRNVLIYLTPVLQRRVMPVLHYALKPIGYLLLGSSETVGAYSDLFAAVDKKHKIYSKRLASRRLALDFMSADTAEKTRTTEPNGPTAKDSFETSLQREVDRLVIGRYAPPGVVVNDNLQILQFRGQTGLYLQPAPGSADFNLFKIQDGAAGPA
jgi:two-component system, chemotaxis family, CheB/CheR fusion protein